MLNNADITNAYKYVSTYFWLSDKKGIHPVKCAPAISNKDQTSTAVTRAAFAVTPGK